MIFVSLIYSLIINRTGNKKDGETVTRYRYNNLDKIIESSYGVKEANVTKYEYDRFGRPVRTIDAMGNSSYNKYDITGNLIQKTDRNGVIMSLSYDGLGRLTNESNAKDKTPTMYTYDSNSLIKTAKDATGTYQFNLDQWEFYVVPTALFNRLIPTQKTIVLSFFSKHGITPCSYKEIRANVDKAIAN